jgi:hypothetical protein
VFGLVLGSYPVWVLYFNRFIAGVDYYMHREVIGLLRVYFISGFCIGYIVFIVLWDIAYAALLQLLACKEPPSDGVEAQ